MKTKMWLSTVGGSILFFILGNIFPITNLYSQYIVSNHDDENKLVAMIVMIEWPLLIAVGGIFGFLFYKKCLNTD